MNTIEELESYLNQKFNKLSEKSYFLSPEKIELKENSNYEKYIILFESNLCKLLLHLSSNAKFDYNKMVNELNFYDTYKEKKELLLSKRLAYKDKLLDTSYAMFDISKFPSLLDDEEFMNSITLAFHSINYNKIEQFYKIEITWRYQIDYLYEKIGKENLDKYLNDPITYMYELKIINIVLQEIEEASENNTRSTTEKNGKVFDNPYPLVFKTGEAYHLFLEVFKHEEKNNTNFSKYFDIFINDDLIHLKIKKITFRKFIFKQFNFKMIKMEDYTSDTSLQQENFKAIKDQFLKIDYL